MPKLLTAVRHAKSSWKDPGLPDRERPLNGRGERDAPAMARYLQRLEHLPDLLLSSPARRALDTARLMADVFGIAESAIVVDDRLYLEGTGGIAAAVRELPDHAGSVFFFSHEPAISAFCRRHARLPATTHYPTAAVCAMRLDLETWAGFGHSPEGQGKPPRAEKLFFVIPRMVAPR